MKQDEDRHWKDQVLGLPLLLPVPMQVFHLLFFFLNKLFIYLVVQGLSCGRQDFFKLWRMNS